MSPTESVIDDWPFKVIIGGVVSVGVELPLVEVVVPVVDVVVPEFPPPLPVDVVVPVVEVEVVDVVVPVFPPVPVGVVLSFVEVELVVVGVSAFITIIDPFTTVDVVADTKGCVLVCSK